MKCLTNLINWVKETPPFGGKEKYMLGLTICAWASMGCSNYQDRMKNDGLRDVRKNCESAVVVYEKFLEEKKLLEGSSVTYVNKMISENH